MPYLALSTRVEWKGGFRFCKAWGKAETERCVASCDCLGFGSGEVKVRRRAYPKQLRLKICIPGQEGTRHTNIVSVAMLVIVVPQYLVVVGALRVSQCVTNNKQVPLKIPIAKSIGFPKRT